jgi:arylsulfatase A-like enzyme
MSIRLFTLVGISILLVVTTDLSAARRPPNIVFILADDVGQEVLGCYGGESYKTPQLDSLARSGLMFHHCYSMPVCHPTRICLLTGRYPFQLDNPRWGTFPVDQASGTIAQVLRRQGYATAIAGKWQITLLEKDLGHPNLLGFDQYCLFGWHEGPRYFEPLIWQDGKRRMDTAGKYGPDLYVDYLVDFFKQNKDRPFFAFYSMALCHDVTDDLDQPVPHGPNDRYESYSEMVASMDDHVGRIITALDDLELRDNTLVLFSTDNGTPKTYIARAEGDKLVKIPVVSQQRGQAVPGGKGDLSDRGTRIPTIASWPGIIGAGTETNALVDFSDMLPTFAQLAGAATPDHTRAGSSFASVLRHPRSNGRPWVFAEGRGGYWLRTESWKLYGDGRFFDMRNDPLERTPLIPETLPRRAQHDHAMLSDAARGLMVDR